MAKLLHDPNLSLEAAMKKSGIVLDKHFVEDGAILFREACKLGRDGILLKWLGSPYRSGRSKCWAGRKSKPPKRKP